MNETNATSTAELLVPTFKVTDTSQGQFVGTQFDIRFVSQYKSSACIELTEGKACAISSEIPKDA